MTTRRDFLRASLLGFAGSLTAGRALWADDTQAMSEMTAAANRLLAGLSTEQRGFVSLPLNDPERFNWHFVPLNDVKKRASARRGVNLEDMSAECRTAAMDLLKTVTSEDGFRWAKDIMDRESMLAELEPNNAWFRKPTWYHFTIYGKPAATGSWGWRIDGHHLSISAAVQDGKLVSATPFFMGVNPVAVKHGPRAGERKTITPSEDLARELFLSLDADQRKIALQAKHLPEVSAKSAKAPTTLPMGLSAAKMTEKQQAALLAVVAHYTGRMPPALAKIETDKLVKAGVEKLHFVYTGDEQPAMGKRHTYAIQGPTCFIHYLNEQTDPQKNPANHIHSVYRSWDNDFGGVAVKVG